LDIKDEKIQAKVAQMKEKQDETVAQSVKDYEELKAETAKNKADTGVEKK
jgi:hypothetical protein